ncbi:MAG: tetratricopeptide repeat protein [Neisseriaceae bacterium]
MALDLQEQEELENVKRIWHSWLKWVVLFLLIAAGVYFFYTAWETYQKSRNEKATDLLMEFQSLVERKEQSKALMMLKELQEKYADTMPATIATAALGAQAFYTNEVGSAEKHFMWIYKHQKNELVRAITIIDLAKIKMQQRKFDEALNLLKEKVPTELAFLFEDLKGDIEMAKGDNIEGEKAYDRAISFLPKPNEVITADDIAEVRSQIEAKKLIQLPKTP